MTAKTLLTAAVPAIGIRAAELGVVALSVAWLPEVAVEVKLWPTVKVVPLVR